MFSQTLYELYEQTTGPTMIYVSDFFLFLFEFNKRAHQGLLRLIKDEAINF